MNNNKSKISCKRGFTLIELLVVVLIIGILAAVAVPQYKIAVQKAQFAKLRTMASSIVKAVRVYYLAHGDWPTAFSELDIEPSLTPTTNNCVKNDEMYCCLVYPNSSAGWLGSIFCGQMNYELAFQEQYATKNSKSITQYLCYEKSEGKFCKTLPGARSYTASSGMMTPGGPKMLQAYAID